MKASGRDSRRVGFFRNHVEVEQGFGAEEYVQVLGCLALVVRWQVLSNSSHLWLMRFLDNHVYGGALR